jgi:hypothetical protein
VFTNPSFVSVGNILSGPATGLATAAAQVFNVIASIPTDTLNRALPNLAQGNMQLTRLQSGTVYSITGELISTSESPESYSSLQYVQTTGHAVSLILRRGGVTSTLRVAAHSLLIFGGDLGYTVDASRTTVLAGKLTRTTGPAR